MTMSCTREQIVAQMQAWIGLKESNGSHKEIIDIYNSHKPRARGYKLKYNDAWCAGTVSAAAIACNATDIIPLEVGCGKMIEKAKKMGIWVEADDYDPLPGDIIVYYWKAKKTGDQKSGASHVGYIETSKNKKYTVIEGNYSNSVKRRGLKNNDYRIRGFITPKYDDSPDVEQEVAQPAVKEEVKVEKPVVEKKAKDSARNFLASLAGTYKVTASALNVRNGAGVTKAKMVAIPKGTAVKCYGYFNYAGSRKWLYIQFTYKGVQYTGFASSKYLKK